MATTLTVLGVLAVGCFLAAVAARRRDAKVLEGWLMTGGLLVVTVWSVLGYWWAQSNPTLFSDVSYAFLAVFALVSALYHGYDAWDRERNRLRH